MKFVSHKLSSQHAEHAEIGKTHVKSPMSRRRTPGCLSEFPGRLVAHENGKEVNQNMKKRILSLFLAMFFVASFVGVACAIQGTVASVNVGQGSVTINVEGTAILPNGQELEFHIGNERLTGTVASFQNGTLTASVNQSDAAKFMPKRNQTVTFSKKVAK